jgi:copper resistance protein B
MDMPGMQMPGMKMHGKKETASTTKQRPKQRAGKPAMPSMNMPGMQMQGKHEAAPSTEQRASTPAMSGMEGMRTHSPQATEMQQLHFGNMIGARPKPDGLANGMQRMTSMPSVSVASMQGGSAPPDARSADHSDGYRYGSMRGMDMADSDSFGTMVLDQLEYAHSSSHGNSEFLDGEASYGKDLDKVWLKAEGESSRGRLRDLRTEGLWDHALTPYWSAQLGVRRDLGVGPDRTWAALGVQGVAPYWFDAEATIYVGQGGRTAARLQLEYDELLTQRWVLQPKVEFNLYGRDDPQRGIGSGLSDAEFGLRLRYEIRRETAPYVGMVYRQRYGHAAHFARAQGEAPDDVQFVLGLHAWF